MQRGGLQDPPGWTAPPLTYHIQYASSGMQGQPSVYLGGHKDLDPLRLSQRSNGLAFSHHHFLSSSPASTAAAKTAKPDHTAPRPQKETRLPTRERLKLATSVADGTEISTFATRQPIRSLIPPKLASDRFYMYSKQSLKVKRRNSESSVSIKSFASSGTLRKRRYNPKPTLATMPAEILELVIMYLAQEDSYALMRTNSNLTEIAARALYKQPLFASTYRYAQFVHTVSHKKHYADMVRVLDVSTFGKEPYGDRKPQAGWREWKYRNSDLHQVNRNRFSRGGTPKGTGCSHPPPNPFLETWSLSRDIPIGGLCHAIIACQCLKKVDISRLQLGSDFIVRHIEHPPTTWTGMIYVSDIQRSWTWEPQELSPIYNMYIVDQLRKLPQLETFIAYNFISLSTLMAQNLVESCLKLKCVDFRKSGMSSEQPWKIKDSREKVAAILRQLEENTLKPH